MTSTDVQKHRWTFEPTFNLGHIIMLIGLLGGGISVYVGVFQTLTNLVIRVQTLEQTSAGQAALRDQVTTNRLTITQLSEQTSSIKSTNEEIVKQLTGLRVDFAKLQGQLAPTRNP